jgi:hypothetical protein
LKRKETVKNKGKAWTDFAAWCQRHRLQPLPAHPWTLAAYARWCEVRHHFPTILTRVRAIARVHLLACVASPDRHPTVTRTLRTIEMRHRDRAARAALFPTDDITRDTGAESTVRSRKKPVGSRRSRVLSGSPRLISRRPQPR